MFMMVMSARVVTCAFLVHFLAHSTVVSSSEECASHSRGTQRELQYTLTHVLLHQEYPRCSSVDFSRHRLVCEIWNAADEAALLCQGERYCLHSSSYLSEHQLFSRCPDETLNKTCMPSGDSYECACYSNKKKPNCAYIYSWDREWGVTDGSQRGMYKELCDPGTGSCIATEALVGVDYLVRYLQIPDSRITASSVQNTIHHPYRLKIGIYMDRPCAWGAALTDPLKWVQIDLLNMYVALGILVKTRCDTPHMEEYPTKIKVEHSLDESSWEFTPSGDIVLVYPGALPSSCTHWFSDPIAAQYWKIYILEYVTAPSMKADIIGTIDNDSTTC